MENTKLLGKLYSIKKITCDNIVFQHVSDLIDDVENEIKTEESKKSGKYEKKKSAERIIKQLENGYSYKLGVYDEFNYQYIGGVYSVVKIKEKIPLYISDEKKNYERMDYEKIIVETRNSIGNQLPLPSIHDLKSEIKIEKEKHKGEKGYIYYYDFGDGLPRVNGMYLLDLLVILGDCKAFASIRYPEKRLIYFENENGDCGVLSPVRKV